jgi:fructose-1,6-bisphosphatase II
MQCRLIRRDNVAPVSNYKTEREDPYRLLLLEDLAKGEDLFFAATGITDGDMLSGVRYRGQTAETHSLVMRGITRTIRNVRAIHKLERKPHFVAKETPCSQ